MHRTCGEWARRVLDAADVRARDVLEVGARDVNGSLRPWLESLHPASYLGVDIEPGRGVDEISRVEDLVDRYGEDRVDLVVATELVEHVRDWRTAFDQMKRVLRPGGKLLVTTRSPGFKVHGYPFDYWRYTPDDMRMILGDFTDLAIDSDSQAPGVFALATKPPGWRPASLTGYPLYSVATRSRIVALGRMRELAFWAYYRLHMLYRRLLPESVRARIRGRGN